MSWGAGAAAYRAGCLAPWGVALVMLMALPARAERVDGLFAGSTAAFDAAVAAVPASSIYALDTLVPETDAEVTAADPIDAVEPAEIDRGNVSWYGGRFHGRRTASGERFNMYALTAAHPSLPFGTRIKVRRLDTGQEVEVRINDRGPHARGRILDLSRGAAQALGVIQAGEAAVALLLP